MAQTSRLSHSRSSRRRAVAKKMQGDDSIHKSFALRVVAALVLMLLVSLGVIVKTVGTTNESPSTAYTR